MWSIFLKRLLTNFTLQVKFLLGFGFALLISLLAAFYAVQAVAERLVIEKTRQAARDYASAVLFWQHYQVFSESDQEPDETDTNTTLLTGPSAIRTMDQLSSTLIQTRYQHDYLIPENASEFKALGGSISQSESEQALLASLLNSFNDSESTPASENAVPSEQNGDAIPQDAKPFTFAAPDDQVVFREAGPVDGFYYYYHPIRFADYCVTCHENVDPSSSAVPQTAMRVRMNYADTRVWTLWTFSLLTTIAIATLGVTLFLVHWLLSRFVVRPIWHLRDVSNAISRGNLERRAELDTGDELSEMADAFNKMLRHITETQSQLQAVNDELDQRIDQLAHANLQLFEANRLKGEFLASMSHELRTPLNSILGFSEVLQNFESLDDKQKRYAANIQKSGRLLLEMINDILDLAKVEAGKMDVQPSHFELAELISLQCELMRGLAEEKNVAIIDKIGDVDLVVYQDRAKIQQILTNLLSNAIKFTPDGGFVNILVSSNSDTEFEIAVQDTGVGIPPAEINVIFQKFRQSRSVVRQDGMTREFAGTGLGLSIVKELTKLLGGEVSVESEIGKGSVFKIQLPLHYQPPIRNSKEISLPVPGLNDSPDISTQL